MPRALALVLAALTAGCALSPEPSEPVEVGLPPMEAGGFAPCASASARPLAVPLSVASFREETGLGAGIHRLDARTLAWVWANYTDTPRDDRVTRVNEVQVFREADGRAVVCTRVELSTPTRTSGELRSYDVGARIRTTAGELPGGDLLVVVNWIAGCECAENPRGNTTSLVPETG